MRAAVLVATVFAPLLACSTTTANAGSDGSDASGIVVEAGTLPIGAAGGTVTSADGVVVVEIPAGALTVATVLRADPIASPAAGNVGHVYNLEPSGTTFAAPVDIAFEVTSAMLDAGQASALTIATYQDGGWTEVASTLVSDTAIAGKISAFAPCALIATGGSGSASCAAGLACTAGTSCSFVDDAGAPTFCACSDAGAIYTCTMETVGAGGDK